MQVEVTRGGVVEALHHVHAVAVDDGRIVASAGDPQLVTFLRSSAKPLQVLPLVRARPDIGDREIAIACASHMALPEQLDVVRSLLAPHRRTRTSSRRAPRRRRSSTTARASTRASSPSAGRAGFETRGYRFRDHPLQRELLEEIADAGGVPSSDVPVAVDGCGVPTFAFTLERSARLFGALPRLEGGPRVVAAMRAHPDLLRGPVAADVELIRAVPGWVAKGGAEGLLCACSPDGLAVALKVEDGSFRAILPALASFLASLGVETGDLGVRPCREQPRRTCRGGEDPAAEVVSQTAADAV